MSHPHPMMQPASVPGLRTAAGFTSLIPGNEMASSDMNM
jgi:hypothetical protein